MARVLHIADAVVTGEVLSRQHRDEEEVCIPPGSVVTPTGWDYIRAHGMQLVRDTRPVAAAQPEAVQEIREVPPAVANGEKVVPESRYEHPDRPYGCKTDEFGSGYADPERSQDGEPGAGYDAQGSQKQAPASSTDAEVEALIQMITDRVMLQLGKA